MEITLLVLLALLGVVGIWGRLCVDRNKMLQCDSAKTSSLQTHSFANNNNNDDNGRKRQYLPLLIANLPFWRREKKLSNGKRKRQTCNKLKLRAHQFDNCVLVNPWAVVPQWRLCFWWNVWDMPLSSSSSSSIAFHFDKLLILIHL